MLITNEDDQSTEEPKNDEKTGGKWPIKRSMYIFIKNLNLLLMFCMILIIFMVEVNKKEQKKRLNARMRRLVCPKSPLMVFSELYKDIPIKLAEQQTHNNYAVYSASIEVRYFLKYNYLIGTLFYYMFNTLFLIFLCSFKMALKFLFLYC